MIENEQEIKLYMYTKNIKSKKKDDDDEKKRKKLQPSDNSAIVWEPDPWACIQGSQDIH